MELTCNIHEHDETICLSDTEAATRLAQDGPNELLRQRQRNVLRVVLDVLHDSCSAVLQHANCRFPSTGRSTDLVAIRANSG